MTSDCLRLVHARPPPGAITLHSTGFISGQATQACQEGLSPVLCVGSVRAEVQLAEVEPSALADGVSLHHRAIGCIYEAGSGEQKGPYKALQGL